MIFFKNFDFPVFQGSLFGLDLINISYIPFVVLIRIVYRDHDSDSIIVTKLSSSSGLDKLGLCSYKERAEEGSCEPISA